MRKIIGIFVAMLMAVSLPLAIYAVGSKTCTVFAESVVTGAGDTVTVAVRIADNPGFTNFSIALEYDPAILTLESIQTSDERGPFLCGQFVSVDTRFAGGLGGCVVAACAETVEGDGILFTATFAVADGANMATAITPHVNYIRNNQAVGGIFEDIHATAQAGTVTIVTPGDLNGDGLVEYDDVMLAYRAYLGVLELSQVQMAMVDENGNGTVEESEYLAIYGIYIGG